MACIRHDVVCEVCFERVVLAAFVFGCVMSQILLSRRKTFSSLFSFHYVNVPTKAESMAPTAVNNRLRFAATSSTPDVLLVDALAGSSDEATAAMVDAGIVVVISAVSVVEDASAVVMLPLSESVVKKIKQTRPMATPRRRAPNIVHIYNGSQSPATRTRGFSDSLLLLLEIVLVTGGAAAFPAVITALYNGNAYPLPGRISVS